MPSHWLGATPLEDMDNPLLPPLDADGHLVTPKRGALSFLRAGAPEGRAARRARQRPRGSVEGQLPEVVHHVVAQPAEEQHPIPRLVVDQRGP